MSTKSDKTREKEKNLEKTQTNEKPQANQSHMTHSFLKGMENKKNETQTQMVETQPLGSEAIQANQTKTPGIVSKENIVELELESEKEPEKKKESEKEPENKKERQENSKENSQNLE